MRFYPTLYTDDVDVPPPEIAVFPQGDIVRIRGNYSSSKQQ
jgi:hypothetical protein